jgi:hypothetical protein
MAKVFADDINLVSNANGPYVVYRSLTVNDPQPGGNGNGRFDPGETGGLIVELRNVGNQSADNVSATLRSGDARFAVTDSASSYGNIPSGGNQNNQSDPFLCAVGSSIPLETVVPLTLFVNGDSYCDTLRFSVTVGQIRNIDPIPDGPRNPPLYWAYDDVDVMYSEHPDYNWIETRGRGTQLVLSDDQTVQVNLPTGFVWKYYGQDYNQISVCGNGFVTPGYSTNTLWTNTGLPNSSAPMMVAANWDDLYPPIGGGVWYFHDAANHCFVVEWDSVAYFSPQTSWDKFEIIIYDTTVHTPTGDNVFTVQYQTANNYVSNTVGIQDNTFSIGIQCLFDAAYHRGTAPLAAGRAIKFTPVEPLLGIAQEPGVRTTRGLSVSALPNPFRGSVNLSVDLNTSGPVLFDIYDNAGRLVRKLHSSNNSTTWDGRNETGNAVVPGVYFYRAATADREAGGKLILSR